MKKTQLNALGAFEDLNLFDKNGNIVYKFLSYSDGYWSKSTYDEKGNPLTFEDSDDYWSKRTYDEKGNKLTYEDSRGIKKGFDIGHKQNYTSDITGEQYYNETFNTEEK
jgi:hypothetical protein